LILQRSEDTNENRFGFSLHGNIWRAFRHHAIVKVNQEDQSMTLTRTQTVISWVLQIAVAIILFQTLFFKFTGAEESKYIFTTVGAEPWGRIASGILELIAVILLLIPSAVTLGAILALGAASGAIMSHLTRLGIVVRDDGGLLFALAVTVFIGSAVILIIRRAEIPVIGKTWFSRRA
jgi:uncharacterized membrane protein YphA (DoxX/SURF4 family)